MPNPRSSIEKRRRAGCSDEDYVERPIERTAHQPVRLLKPQVQEKEARPARELPETAATARGRSMAPGMDDSGVGRSAGRALGKRLHFSRFVDFVFGQAYGADQLARRRAGGRELAGRGFRSILPDVPSLNRARHGKDCRPMRGARYEEKSACTTFHIAAAQRMVMEHYSPGTTPGLGTRHSLNVLHHMRVSHAKEGAPCIYSSACRA